ncbi:unnamed protein product [Hymenolepis diminuta]|uniref:UDP-N-acetylglucosamine--dolichyl-phosphate N-acetylglucosaminephosphotransferase n=1 Tax=Hymenolepis diminuta TaxID=6216 RepID=A0A0R3SG25_HYMDI|nr:unnamed protein product [Hymenolepis diminuta]
MSPEKISLDKFGLEFCVISFLSIVGYFLTKSLLKSFGPVFIKAGLHGADMNKPNRPVIPEAQGVLAATVYINIMFLFIPLPFRKHIIQSIRLYDLFSSEPSLSDDDILLIPFLAALLSICCMIFLGFADDVLNLRWRHKLILPTLSSLPILMVHIANIGTTHIAVPLFLHRYLGTSPLYYVYMGMLAVFCTNAINIYAGINGLEAGQSVAIALSVIVFNLIEFNGVLFFSPNGTEWRSHLFSFYFLLPFTGVTFALLQKNWFPATIFVGDTFCYFAGMTFAVVGILGHFSKTLMLFFIPQVFNFILSLPQLFRLIPCPRHRLPRQVTVFMVSMHLSSLSPLGRLYPVCVDLDAKEEADSGESVTIDNLTVINLFLRLAGPMAESRVTTYLLVIQVLCSCLAFGIRYPLAQYLYG